MNPLQTLTKLSLLLLALSFVACSPQLKVQQYSYLLKNKTDTQLEAGQKTPPAKPQFAFTSKRKDTSFSSPVFKKPNPRKNYSVSVSVEPVTTSQTALKYPAAMAASTSTKNYTPVSKVAHTRLIPSTGGSASTTMKPMDMAAPIATTEMKSPIEVPGESAGKPLEDPASASSVFSKFQTQRIIKTAQQYLGTPYKYGEMSRKGIDCSGLVCQAYNTANIQLPRNSQAMANSGRSIPVEELKPGYLVFFHSHKGEGINHVGLVVSTDQGEITFIHSTVHGGVRIDKLSDPYWNQRFRRGIVPVLQK